MKATEYTNKELVEIYKNLKTSAKILGFSSASDSEMIVEIELEAAKRHLNLVDGTVEETAETETAKSETAETDDSGFEYYSVDTAEVSKEVKEQFEKQKTSFKFYDVGIAYQVERYVNCGNLKYVQLGTYSDYAKAVKAAQEAIESWGEENIYFHTVEFAKRSSEPIKNNKKVFKSETHEIDYYWISARLTDTKECGYINIDSPIRIPNV